MFSMTLHLLKELGRLIFGSLLGINAYMYISIDQLWIVRGCSTSDPTPRKLFPEVSKAAPIPSI